MTHWTIRYDRLDAVVDRMVVWSGERRATFAEVVAGWRSVAECRESYASALASSRFDAYFWEHPSLREGGMDHPYECVLVEAPSLHLAPADREPFRSHFERCRGMGVLTFDNLGGDATLVVPCPVDGEDDAVAAHLAGFMRGASTDRKHDLLAAVSAAVEERLSASRALWLSTSGLGVAWLHVRLDSRPKYYAHAPYRAG